MVATSPPCITELPSSTGTRSMTPSKGAFTSLRSSSACAVSSCDCARVRLERAVSSCSLGRLPVFTSRSAASSSAWRCATSCLALSTHRDLFLGGQHQHQVAGLDVIALLDRQLVDDAGDARRQNGALVGLGQPGNADGARIGLARRRHHRDGAQRRLRLGFGRLRLARRPAPCPARLRPPWPCWPLRCRPTRTRLSPSRPRNQ